MSNARRAWWRIPLTIAFLLSTAAINACGSAASQDKTQLGESSDALVSCSSDCSGVTGSSPITVSNCTTCSANNTSVTCDGTTTQCTACTPNQNACSGQCGGTTDDGCGHTINCHDSCGLAGDCPCRGGRCVSNYCECYSGWCF